MLHSTSFWYLYKYTLLHSFVFLSSTYNEIEGSAQYFWCYQRYEMIQEFVDRPSVAAPFMLLWYSVEFTGFLFSLIGGTLFDHAIEEIKDDDPFCKWI